MAPPERKKLALAPRTKPAGGSEDTSSGAGGGKANPFGAAKAREGKVDDYLTKEGEKEFTSRPKEGEAGKGEESRQAKHKVDPFTGKPVESKDKPKTSSLEKAAEALSIN